MVEEEDEDDDDDDDYMSGWMPPHMTVHVVQPSSSRSGRQNVLTPMPRGSASSKTKAFFDELINVSSPRDAEAAMQGRRRSRLIYIRDYPTLAPSASSWYPSLLTSVRQRRQGPIPRPTSPAANPMTIIFGMTPPIVQPSQSTSRGGPSMIGLMNARRTAVVGPNAKANRKGYGEDEPSDKTRERRLRDRLRRWERDEQAFHDEMPRLPQSTENSNVVESSGIVIPLHQAFANAGVPFSSSSQGRSGGRIEDGQESSHFFRTSVLVPSLRNHALERTCRVSRRREINGLTIRMAVGAIGGKLEDGSAVLHSPSEEADSTESKPVEAGSQQAEPVPVSSVEPKASDAHKMWEEWGKRIETWADVKDIADRAVGYVVATDISTIRSSLEPTPIPWQAVITAWGAKTSLRDIRKSWLHESSAKLPKDQTDDEPGESTKLSEDEVIQRVKEDPELMPHEQRLLGCIVNAGRFIILFLVREPALNRDH